MKRLEKSVQKLARLAGGSHKTVHDRIAIVGRVFRCLKQLNIQIKDIEHLKAKHARLYVEHRLAQCIKQRTVQNEMSALRKVLRECGRDKLADSEGMSNKALKLAGASRAGTKSAIPDDLYQNVLSKALQKDEGLAATIQLARTFGLRSEEAVQSIHSLETWQKELSKSKKHITVVFGTKGGRPRQTRIIDRQKAIKAVEFAINIAKQRNGKLIDKPNLQQAMTYWRNHTRRLGLTGEHSPHSLRYAWAQEAGNLYRDQGYSAKEADAMTAMDLGHGDGRGRYVKRIYGTKINSNE